jgi:endonuclease YncB( thermonuclease family)
MLHNCKVTRVIDADTFLGVAELDFGVSIVITVRLLGCDAYEIHGPEKPSGLKAKEYVTALIGGQNVVVDPFKRDSFGRWLCDVMIKGKSMVEFLKDEHYLK